MKPVDAVVILSECRETAEKLVADGPEAYLDLPDLQALRKYLEVEEEGWADNYDVRRLSGLSVPMLSALSLAVKTRLNKPA